MILERSQGGLKRAAISQSRFVGVAMVFIALWVGFVLLSQIKGKKETPTPVPEVHSIAPDIPKGSTP